MPSFPKTISFSLSTCIVAIGLLTATSSTYAERSERRDVLLLAEYGVLSLADPENGSIRDIPLKLFAEHPQGLTSTPGFIISTMDEAGAFVFQELTVDGTLVKQHAIPMKPLSDFAVSPNGDMVLISPYTDGKPTSIRIEKLGGTESRLLFEDENAVRLSDLRWSPNQQQIAFTRQAMPPSDSRRFDFAVCLLALSDQQTICLNTNPTKVTMIPAFSPDGRYLAFFERERYKPESEWTLYMQELSQVSQPDSRIKVASITPQRWRSLSQLQWSPDGEWLSWMERRDEPFPRFFKIHPTGNDLQEMVIHRPWSRRAWRSIWPLEPATRCCFGYHWWIPPIVN